jgi:multiple sugar transport system permease protein
MVTVTTAARRRGPQRRRLGRIANRVAFGFAVFVIVSPAILVFLWMLSLSFKPEIENIAYPPIFIPEHPTLANFARVFEASPFGHYLVNSLIVTGSATLLAIMVGVPAGYGIAKAKAYRLAVLVLIARITPNLSYLIPLFIVFQMLGLTGTLWPMVITHLVITVPIVVWVMIGFFETLHPDLEEAALIDGATLWQAFRYIALPLSRPGVVVAAILAFIFSWNNFIFGVVLAGRETRTLPVAVYNVLTFEQISWGPLAAAALLVTLPVLVLTVVIQREIVGGLAAGGVKGG